MLASLPRFFLVLARVCADAPFAQQCDAPYYELQKKHATRWPEEDKAVDARFVALEKKFGKKSNIIYILVKTIRC